MLLILFGAPGVGKGTIAQRLQEDGVGRQVSTGDLFRKEISVDSEVGQIAKKYIYVGQLVPDDITRKIVENEIAGNGNILLDGYPRTVKQIQDLNEILASHCMKVNLVVNVVTDENIVIDRIVNRVICANCHAIYNKKYCPPKISGKCDKCNGSVIHRSDDSEEIVKNRFKEYEKKTSPLLEYYRKNSKFIKVDSDDSNAIEKIKQALRST
ncbi:MAG: nucleoside monophosphate kinase [Candidatus Micrarchaeota archaeon]